MASPWPTASAMLAWWLRTVDTSSRTESEVASLAGESSTLYEESVVVSSVASAVSAVVVTSAVVAVVVSSVESDEPVQPASSPLPTTTPPYLR
jgi:hypothetical protein